MSVDVMPDTYDDLYHTYIIRMVKVVICTCIYVQHMILHVLQNQRGQIASKRIPSEMASQE